MVAFSIYQLFVVSVFLHLTSRFPALGAMRFDFILMAVLFGFWALSLGQTLENYRTTDISKRLLKFVAYFLLTIPFVKWPGSVIRYGTEFYLKVVFFYFFTVSFVTTEKRLKIFLGVFLGCQFFRGLEPAWLHYTQGYWGDFAASMVGGKLELLNRLSGAPHDIVNPNQLAWVIVNTAPFIFFLGWFKRGVLVRASTALLSGGLLYTLMLTGSRSGLVCLFVVLIGIVFFSEKRWKNIAILVFVVTPAFMIISGLLSPQMAERYRSLIDSSAVGADTAQGRFNGLKNNLSTIMNAHGLLGHGLGTSREVNVNYLGGRQPSHNLYLETLQEVGILGFFLFLKYIISIFRTMYSLTKQDNIEKEGLIYRTTQAIVVWAFMQFIYDLSCFGLSSWEWYLFGGLCVAVLNIHYKSEKIKEKQA
jgi:putative inorganic carbon (hco3(-)) transporter